MPKFEAQKKQLDKSTYLFEYWEQDNTLRATGSKEWVDKISLLITRVK